MKNSAKPVLMLGRVLLGVALFWVVAKKTEGWNLAFPALASSAILLPVIAFSLVGAVIEALRFATLLRAQGASIAFGDSFRLVTAAFSLNFCIPGGATGDVSRLYYLRDAHGGKGWELATAIFVDRLVGMLSMLLLVTLLGVACWPVVRNSPVFLTLFFLAAALMAAILVFAALCLSTAPALRRWLGKVLSAMPLGHHLERIAESFFRFSDHRTALLRALSLSFSGSLAAAAMFSILAWSLYPHAPFPVPALLSLIGLFANIITITPGGLGVGEAAFEVLFAEAGLQGGAAMMIVWRVGMVPICLLGLAFYMAGLRPRPA
jgi:uncharacterized protein (TIRG00374 family)